MRKHVLRTSLCVVVLVTLTVVASDNSGSATTASLGQASVHSRFSSIGDKALPGLPPSNWPTVQSVAPPPGVTAAANVGSNDLKYTVAFYDFPSSSAARAFYDAPPGALLTFLWGAQGYASLNGPTGVPGRTRGVDLRSCVGEGAGLALFPNGQCSDGSRSFSIGVGSITQVGPVVMMVGYVRTNALTAAANSVELDHTAKVALSGLSLLRSIGVGSR